ncbi:MAG: DNA gyrase inhibitor YacG [Planctomycetota bacterium]|nr:DNA gyrase inhibitor YacG [Planctomycetota bacterium]
MIRPLTCPICDKPAPPPESGGNRYFPFCSERCRQIDLLRWSKGQYQIVEELSPERLREELEHQGLDDEFGDE